jgi:hypothetical protein
MWGFIEADMTRFMLKCLLVTNMTAFTFLSFVPLTVATYMFSNSQYVQVLTLPSLSNESYLVIVTPCSERNSASIGVWTARSGSGFVKINALHNWPEMQSFFEERSLDRFLWRTTTMRNCVP